MNSNILIAYKANGLNKGIKGQNFKMYKNDSTTVMHCLVVEIPLEKCVTRQIYHCVNVIDCISKK